MPEQSVSSYEQRIIAAALKLAENAEDPNASSEAVSEIVLCARGMLRRAQREPLEDLRLGQAIPDSVGPCSRCGGEGAVPLPSGNRLCRACVSDLMRYVRDEDEGGER